MNTQTTEKKGIEKKTKGTCATCRSFWRDSTTSPEKCHNKEVEKLIKSSCESNYFDNPYKICKGNEEFYHPKNIIQEIAEVIT